MKISNEIEVEGVKILNEILDFSIEVKFRGGGGGGGGEFSVSPKAIFLCSPKNFGGAYSRRFVRASVRPSRSCPRKFSETACRISMKLHGNIKYQRWMRISPACSGSMIFPRVIAL